MDELTHPISTATGLDPDVARKAVGVVLDFIQKTVSPGEASAVIDRVPGGREAAAAAAEDEAEGGGTAAPGLEGLVNRLLAEGLATGDLEGFARAALAGLRRLAGPDAVAKLTARVPELSMFD